MVPFWVRPSKMTKATLSLSVVYSGSDADTATIRDLLQSMVEHAADRGLLTGDKNLVVEESDFEIEVVEE